MNVHPAFTDALDHLQPYNQPTALPGQLDLLDELNDEEPETDGHP
ncbi:hypothetical protein [Brachybacterium sp. NPDC056505]